MDQQRNSRERPLTTKFSLPAGRPRRHGSTLGGAIHGSTLPMISDRGK
jgi:hypothetical protein